MTRYSKWFGATVVAAAMALVIPGTAKAKHGADDLTPEVQKPERPGHKRHGADDLVPETQKPERPGHKLAKNGADDLVPEVQKPERPGHKFA